VGQPNNLGGNEDRLQFVGATQATAATWNDSAQSNVTFVHGYMVEYDSKPLEAAVLTGPVSNEANGHIYYLLSANTWTASEAATVSLGGHLITINDTNENHWVYTNFIAYGGVDRALWIGLFQPPGSPEPDGGWRWVSGEAANFRCWITNTEGSEPNNNTNRGPQNWAMMWSRGVDGIALPYAAEKWNDYWDVPSVVDEPLTNLMLGLYGVVEVTPPGPAVAIARSDSQVTLTWPGSATGNFYLQAADSLSPQILWTNAPEPTTNGTDLVVTDDATGSIGFYRLQAWEILL
jgi:Lectin C-type domain